jgi:hypothetical protein
MPRSRRPDDLVSPVDPRSPDLGGVPPPPQLLPDRPADLDAVHPVDGRPRRPSTFDQIAVLRPFELYVPWPSGEGLHLLSSRSECRANDAYRLLDRPSAFSRDRA